MWFDLKSLSKFNVYACLLVVALACASCKHTPDKKKENADAGTQPAVVSQNVDSDSEYFSINEFMDDQWKYLKTQAYVLKRYRTVNNVQDSAYAELNDKLFRELKARFGATDISGAACRGKYQVTLSLDTAQNMVNLLYIAADPALPTRQTLLSMDKENARVTQVYVSTQSDSNGTFRTQNLLYVPEKVIQIQEYEQGANAEPVNTKIIYKFPTAND